MDGVKEYPARVTLFEDGVYRWSYDMDMWRNRYLLTFLVKVLAAICAPLCALILYWLGPKYMNLRTYLIMALCVAGLYAMMLGIYAVCALAMRGVYHLCYEMDAETVVLVQSPATRERNDTLSAIASLARVAPGGGRLARRVGGTLAMAEVVGTTYFANITRVRPHPEWDVINLREWFGMNQIYIGAEDYAFVRDYILDHVRESAK